MAKTDWKDELRKCFESLAILERCKKETSLNFRQFCEFIAEPAFEALAEELKTYEIKSKHSTRNGRSICCQFDFRRSKTDHFHYTIFLPKNSIELRLRLQLRGRRTPNGPLVEKTEAFMPDVPLDKVMKLGKDELLSDIIAHYRDFCYESLTMAE
jgi:hypothetical protein